MKKIFILLISFFALGISINEVKAENTIINTHSSLEHSKIDVIEKYNSTFNTFNYGTSIYESEPSLTAPYYEGTLKENVTTSVLNQINYFRWLSGLNEVTLNTDKMQRSQKGALINAVNDTLTHYPTQPSDMEDDFYDEAYAGVNANWDYNYTDTYSGNVTWGSSVNSFIPALVDDSGVSSVGHRYSILDPYAFMTSFGFIDSTSYRGRYGSVSMYYDNTNENTDGFYPYPFAGYFPIETISLSSSTQYWSIYLVDYDVTDDTKITINYNGNTYEIDNSSYTYTSNKIIYEMPADLRSAIVKNSRYIDGTKIDFIISDLLDGYERVNLEYTTNFISAKIIDLNDINLCIKSSSDSSCSNIGNNYEFDLNKEYTGEILLSPTNATIDDVTVNVLNENILSYDENTGNITLKETGSTKIEITENYTGFSKQITVNVVVPSAGIELNKTSLSIVKGSTFQLKANLLPTNTTDTATYTWNSNDSKIASVDEFGVVTGNELGTTKIIVNSSNGLTKEIEVNVIDYIKGDMSYSGTIELADVIIALRMSLGFDEATDQDKIVGDMNDDGEVTLTDVILILRKSLGFD